MEEKIMRIDCYIDRFETNRLTFKSEEELREYCCVQFSDGSKPDRITMYFIGMIPINEMERIANWKKETLDAMINK